MADETGVAGIAAIEDGRTYTWPTPDAVEIEGPRLPDLRWVIRDGERVLQQAVAMQRGFYRWVEWRDVQVETDPETAREMPKP